MGWGMNWETGVDVCALPYVKHLVGKLRIAQGAQLCAL